MQKPKLRTRVCESVCPLQGSKSPKSGKEGFGVKKTPIFSQCPRNGRFESKNPNFSTGLHKENGDFLTQSAHLGALGNGSSLTPEPSFPDFGNFDFCRARTLRKPGGGGISTISKFSRKWLDSDSPFFSTVWDSLESLTSLDFPEELQGHSSRLDPSEPLPRTCFGSDFDPISTRFRPDLGDFRSESGPNQVGGWRGSSPEWFRPGGVRPAGMAL